MGVLLYVPMLSVPWVTFNDCGFHSVKAFTGPADQLRHDSQWQYPIPAGSPETSNCTSPQKQLPSWIFSLAMLNLPVVSKQVSMGGILPIGRGIRPHKPSVAVRSWLRLQSVPFG